MTVVGRRSGYARFSFPQPATGTTFVRSTTTRPMLNRIRSRVCLRMGSSVERLHLAHVGGGSGLGSKLRRGLWVSHSNWRERNELGYSQRNSRFLLPVMVVSFRETRP